MASIKTRGPKNAKRYYVNYDIGRTAEGSLTMFRQLAGSSADRPPRSFHRVQHR